MSINLEHLKNLDRAQLVRTAQECGVKFHHKLGDEKLIKAIVDHVMLPDTKKRPDHTKRTEDETHPALRPVEAALEFTAEEVEAELAKLKASKPNLRTSYNEEEKTWKFEWVSNSGRVMAEESGTLCQPLHRIKNRAAAVSRGPLLLRSHAPTAFDSGNAGGNSAYTNVVLA